MDGTSLTPEQEKLNALRQVLPEAFSEGKIDWEKLKATLGEDINFANERYVLNWAGKSDAFKVLQMPTTKTLIPAKDESVNFDDTENIFIEGENLEVLKVLQKSYFGKVKMIYIDPPYNTGNDSFIYPDKFSESKADYEKRVGDKDEEGYMTKDGMFKKNSKENGQYHSNWLNMMMPRLYLAKNLLKQDGVIFVSIDDNEVHNLRLLMNEIFGEENFVESFIWRRRKTQANLSKYTAPVHDYILCYSKSKEFLEINRIPYSKEFIKKTFKNPDNDPKGVYQTGPLARPANSSNKEYELTMPNGRKITAKWSCSQETFDRYVAENRLVIPRDGEGMPRIKIYLSELPGQIPNSWLDNIASNDEASNEIEELFGTNAFFSFPKPTKLIQHLQLIGANKDDVILDFFAGSGTTAHAVMELNKEDGGNRKYICVQLPELCDEKSEAYKAGYKTIADISKERIRRAGKKIQAEIEEEKKKKSGQLNFENQGNQENQINQGSDIDLGFKVLKLADSNFKQWQQIEGKDAKALAEQMKLFVDPVSETATIENMVYELLLKSGKDLNSRIEKKGSFYKINDNELVLLLEKATQEIIDAVIAEKPIKVIALDKLFKGNDQLKTNTVLQMKDAGVEFKTI
jgi:adenine-specific DNA-methyltransferase